jgi:hypothetical protein
MIIWAGKMLIPGKQCTLGLPSSNEALMIAMEEGNW